MKFRFLLGFKMVNYRIRPFCQHQERTNERIIEFRGFPCATKSFEQSGVYELKCTSFVNLSQGYLIDQAFFSDFRRGSSPSNLILLSQLILGESEILSRCRIYLLRIFTLRNFIPLACLLYSFCFCTEVQGDIRTRP